MNSLILIALIFFSLGTFAVNSKSKEIDLEQEDCLKFHLVSGATDGLIKLRQSDREGACILELNEEELSNMDKRLIGFAGTKIFIVENPVTVKKLRKILNSRHELKSKKTYQHISTNERLFATPAVLIRCFPNQNSCTISIAQDI